MFPFKHILRCMHRTENWLILDCSKHVPKQWTKLNNNTLLVLSTNHTWVSEILWTCTLKYPKTTKEDVPIYSIVIYPPCQMCISLYFHQHDDHDFRVFLDDHPLACRRWAPIRPLGPSAPATLVSMCLGAGFHHDRGDRALGIIGFLIGKSFPILRSNNSG